MKLLESGSFNVCRNAVVLMIAMLDCSEIDLEVPDIDMKTVESDDCKEVLENNRDANGILATMWERARFFCKDG